MRKLALVWMVVGACQVAYAQQPVPSGTYCAKKAECLPGVACQKDGALSVVYGRQSAPGAKCCAGTTERLALVTCQQKVPLLSKVPGVYRLLKATKAAPLPAPEKTTTGSRLEHLLKAAEHLEAAGEPEHAQKLRQLAQEETQILLKRLAILEAEVSRLRQLTGRQPQVIGQQPPVTDRQPQVLVQLKLIELSRAKLHKVAFVCVKPGDVVGPRSATAAADKGERVHFRVFPDPKTADGMLEALRQDGLVKVLAEPTVVTVSGRPAVLRTGCEVAVPVAEDSGKVSIEYRKLGTEVDLVPTVLENGTVRMKIRARHSRLDPTQGAQRGDRVLPGVRTRQIETRVAIPAGQTLVIGGLVQTPVAKGEAEGKDRGETPKAQQADDESKPATEETELLLMVTPRIVEPGVSRSARLPSKLKATKQ